MREPSISKISEALTNWSKRTTLRAISLIINSKSKLKRCLWASFILLFAAVLAQKIDQLVTDYFKYNAVSQIKLIDDKSPDFRVGFPMVAFKFINWLNYSSYLKKTGKLFSTESPYTFLMISPFGPREAFFKAKNKFRASFVIEESRFESEEGEKLSLNKELILNSIISCRFDNITCGIDDFLVIEGRSHQSAHLVFKNPYLNKSHHLG